jgi:hypothetical protein
MRLQQIDETFELPTNYQHIEPRRTNASRDMSMGETKQNIDMFYQSALTTDEAPYWLQDGVIKSWAAAANDWFSSVPISRSQAINKKWIAYAKHLHHLHYLRNFQVVLDVKAEEIDAQRAEIKIKLANVEAEAEQMLSGKQKEVNKYNERNGY